MELGDFVEANTDGDKSGIGDELLREYNKSIKILHDEEFKLRHRNAKVKLKRKLNK